VYEENKVCFEQRTVSGSTRLVKLKLRCNMKLSWWFTAPSTAEHRYYITWVP